MENVFKLRWSAIMVVSLFLVHPKSVLLLKIGCASWPLMLLLGLPVLVTAGSLGVSYMKNVSPIAKEALYFFNMAMLAVLLLFVLLLVKYGPRLLNC